MTMFGLLALLLACCGIYNGVAIVRDAWRVRIHGWRSEFAGGLVMVAVFLAAALAVLVLLIGWRP